jgi:pyrimidine-nucleoside phosphorylase
MSKKLAVHADGIILDVKVGSGAFMKNLEEARELAKTMFDLGKAFDRNIVCLLTNMDEPLGNAVGNALEVIEAIETLKGRGPSDFTHLVEVLGAQALILKGDVKTLDEGIERVKEVIENGEALENLKKFIKGSGGDPNICMDYSLLNVATEKYEYVAPNNGHIKHIDAEKIGKAAMMLGAGRAKKEDEIDHSVGLIMHKKVGSEVKKGESILTLYHKNNVREEIIETLNTAFVYSDEEIEKIPTILDIVK